MNIMKVEFTTGQISTHRMAFKTFPEILAQAQEMITSASVAMITIETPERTAHVTKTGFMQWANFKKDEAK